MIVLQYLVSELHFSDIFFMLMSTIASSLFAIQESTLNFIASGMHGIGHVFFFNWVPLINFV